MATSDFLPPTEPVAFPKEPMIGAPRIQAYQPRRILTLRGTVVSKLEIGAEPNPYCNAKSGPPEVTMKLKVQGYMRTAESGEGEGGPVSGEIDVKVTFPRTLAGLFAGDEVSLVFEQ